jgi:hypothetical protein
MCDPAQSQFSIISASIMHMVLFWAAYFRISLGFCKLGFEIAAESSAQACKPCTHDECYFDVLGQAKVCERESTGFMAQAPRSTRFVTAMLLP